MKVKELLNKLAQAELDGWGELEVGVMQKDPNGPGYIPFGIKFAEVHDWWGNSAFCITMEDENENT